VNENEEVLMDEYICPENLREKTELLKQWS